ncbi:hypothetical protein FHU26_001036 [Clostridium beijerinckii]|nr:hypothetical protein [Clostridium beijerinckii]
MLVVVVFPLVPVTRITLYPLLTCFKIDLSIFKAILPGKLLPPFTMCFAENAVIFDSNMLKIDLILISLTAQF